MDYLHVPADPTLMLKASYQAFPFFLLLKTQYSAITNTHGTLAQSHHPQFPQTHYYYYCNYHYCIPPCSTPPTCQCTPCPHTHTTKKKTQLPKNQTHPKTLVVRILKESILISIPNKTTETKTCKMI